MLILIITCYLFNNNLIFIYNNILLILIIFFLFEYKYNLQFFKNTILQHYNVNTNLINGVVLIHPLLIYLTYTIFIVFIFFFKFNFKIFNKILIFLNKYKLSLFNFSFIALFLGGW